MTGLVQAPLQVISSGAQVVVQLPIKQRCEASQALPQVPQFARSLVRSAQLLPHCTVPAGHVLLQTPRPQTKPVGQTLPHEPQFSGSLAVSAHAPLQLLC